MLAIKHLSASSTNPAELVYDHVVRRATRLTQTPFSLAMADTSVDPKARLAFAPRLAPVVLSSVDFNRSMMQGRLPEVTEAHVIPDATQTPSRHAQRFVDDLVMLGIVLPKSWPEIVRALWWMAEIGPTRMLIPRLSTRIASASPGSRALVVHAASVADGIVASMFRQAADAYATTYGSRLRYFADARLVFPSMNARDTEVSRRELSVRELSGCDVCECIGAIDGVFECFDAMLEDLHQGIA